MHALSLAALVPLVAAPALQDADDAPVTIKELDVEDAIREFQEFQERLVEYQGEIGEGQQIARETSEILEELRATATPENGFNEDAILQAIEGYVDGVLQKQVELVDFLESQRYRISYYANKMASSVRPEDIAFLFGTEEQNDVAIAGHVQAIDASKRNLADFVDALPPDQFDPQSFRPKRGMPATTKRKLDELLLVYQQERNALDLAKKRLQLVRATARSAGGTAPELDFSSELLVGQMFGALDRVRLQMSIDLVYLEQLLGGYSRSSRTQEILDAFQALIDLQGDLEGPSPELSSVMDWLQDSSARRIALSAKGLERPGLQVPRYSDLLREAYEGARPVEQ
jgi:hypothetical protein